MQPIALQPIDGVHITTLDNSSDVMLPDEGGLVRCWGLNGAAGPLPIITDGMAVDGQGIDLLRTDSPAVQRRRRAVVCVISEAIEIQVAIRRGRNDEEP